MRLPSNVKGSVLAPLVLVAIFTVFTVGCSETSHEDLDLDHAIDLVTDILEDEGEGGEDGETTQRSGDQEPIADVGATLAGLTVENEGSMEGYSRELFPHWSTEPLTFGWEEPANGCDVRDAALIRDGTGVEISEECEIYAGAWTDPFTGAELTDPQDLDIDHLVPLAEAYRSGAAGWSTADREAFANDPGVLIAADDGENQAKSDSGPEDWRPPDTSFWCDYAIRWTLVKDAWGLAVDEREKTALEEMLSTCTQR